MEKLISYFIPENYQLSLRINKQIERLYGKVIITGKQVAKIFKLHAVDLTVTSVAINGAPQMFKQEFGTLVLETPEVLKEDLVIEINYHTKLQRNMEGAYLSTYQYQGKEERIVTTQFESHYARNCFPCVDEPAAKATFDLKIITPDTEDTVISNMPVKSERVVEHPTITANFDLDTEKTAKKKIVEFERTPKMSTYLLAFVLGKFHQKSVKNKDGVMVTTYCALNQKPETLDYANQIAAEALEFYNKKFGIKYPLPKLDQVALPDFEAGAMENWGLVTYRESCLLADKNSQLESKEYIATVICHELSHQWFGNLVTMQWWDDLWLNESFATVMEYIATDALCPDYHIWEKFYTGECLAAMTRDALPGVQAVKQEVNDPAEIATLFDASIVYAKGARLIYMLMSLMGKKEFFAGIKDYFKAHKYSNTTGDDLWAALQPHAKFNVKEFMNAWISQPGYPVITDNIQQRFLVTGGVDDTKWPLPEIKNDMSGHYLINLSNEEFKAALGNFAKLSEEQRYRLLIDRMLLVETPLVSTASMLDLLPEFKAERSKAIWDLVTGIINKLKIFAPYKTVEYNHYREYVAELIAPVLKDLGVKAKRGEDVNNTKLRAEILSLALYTKDQEITKRLADLYSDDYEKLNSETRYAILTAKMEEDESVYDTYVKAYAAAASPDLKADLLAAFTDVEKPSNVKKVLKLLEEPEVVRPQDHIYLMSYLLRNPVTKEKALAWLYEHWDYVKEITGDKSLDDYARIAARVVRTHEEAERYFAFFDKIANEPAFTRTITVARQEINARLRWLELDSAAFAVRLKNVGRD